MTSLMTLNQHKIRKIMSYIPSLKCETMGKLINRIPGSASLAMSTSVLKALPGKLDIKRCEPEVFSI